MTRTYAHIQRSRTLSRDYFTEENSNEERLLSLLKEKPVPDAQIESFLRKLTENGQLAYTKSLKAHFRDRKFPHFFQQVHGLTIDFLSSVRMALLKVKLSVAFEEFTNSYQLKYFRTNVSSIYYWQCII